MSKTNSKLFITVGAIGLIALTCLNWLIVVGLLFLALIIWLASNDINNGDSRYTSSYTRSNQEYNEPKSPLEYSSSPHYIQQKAKHVADSIKAFIDNIIDNKAGLVNSNDLFSFWGVDVSAYQTLHKRHLDNLINGLHKLRYGIVPDYQHGNKRLDYNEHCVLYKLPKNFIHKNLITVHQAEIFLKLLSVLMNGQLLKSEDLEYINRCIGELAVQKEYHGYLNAYILWRVQKKQPYDKKTKDEVAELPSESKRIFVKLLTEAVSLNGSIDNDRMEALKKILPTLNADSASVHSLVHQSLTDDGFAIVETRSAATEYTIRKPDQKKPSTLILDEKKLGELKQQTEIAQSLLSDIFVDENEEQTTSSPAKSNMVLDTLHKLLEKDSWQRDEVADMLGAGVMIGNLLEQINDYAYSIVDDIVVEEDGETIYVTTEYKEQLI